MIIFVLPDSKTISFHVDGLAIGIRLHSLGLDMHMIPHLEGTAAWRTPVCQAFDVDQPN